MILFVSGRCDIPAYYADWFYHRLDEGFVDVRNPFNPHQISRILINTYHTDAILFCTKNPLPMMNRLDEIKGIPYIFHITITPYHQDIEKHVLNKSLIIDAVKQLSNKITPDRVVVRYDPILLSNTYTIAYHKKAFEKLLSELEGYITTCIISFVDEYKNTKKHMKEMNMYPLQYEQMIEVARVLGEIAKKYRIKLQTCGEDIDLRMYGIENGACVSKEIMEDLIHHPYEIPKGKPVRNCKCLPFVDIGDYNCCGHLCTYCYANYDEDQVQRRMRMHNPKSTVLLGEITKEDKIHVRKEKSVRQYSFLDD